jgi:hypothetical protein
MANTTARNTDESESGASELSLPRTDEQVNSSHQSAHHAESTNQRTSRVDLREEMNSVQGHADQHTLEGDENELQYEDNEEEHEPSIQLSVEHQLVLMVAESHAMQIHCAKVHNDFESLHCRAFIIKNLGQ